jgi:acetylornithine deacetylase/succinyl-diaminopimelate desuccinylase-like protein
MTTASDTGEIVELLQALIRNECVNDGDIASGDEIRNARLLADYLSKDCEVEVFEPYPGRGSLVARIEGSDPDAPKVCLMGHVDVVPVSPDGWDEDPFGGELINGEIWGRGAVDMLNLTSSMAVVFRRLAAERFRPKGDLIFFGVADEEAGGTYGARWFSEHRWDAIACDYVLTENGGLTSRSDDGPVISMHVAEKGYDWRTLTVHGTPGHGSMPFRSDNALVRASEVVRRLAEYRPAAHLNDLWRERVGTMRLSADLKAALLDPDKVWEACNEIPAANAAALFHACTHTTMSPNMVSGGQKVNIIPDRVTITVDIRTMPGDGPAQVDAHLASALGDLADHVTVTPIAHSPASRSPHDTDMWKVMEQTVDQHFPGVPVVPQMMVGLTDARFFRDHGTIAYGAGLLSPSLNGAEFGARFHGHNERIDLASLQLSASFWEGVIRRFRN